MSPSARLKRILIYTAFLVAGVAAAILVCDFWAVSIHGPCWSGWDPASDFQFQLTGSAIHDLTMIVKDHRTREWRTFEEYARTFGEWAVEAPLDARNPFPRLLHRGQHYGRLAEFPADADKGQVPILWSTRPFHAGRPLTAPEGTVWVLCLDGTVRVELLTDVNARVEAIKARSPLEAWRGEIRFQDIE